MTRFRTGERIQTDFLGKGEVVMDRREYSKRIGGDIGLILVKFDETPPVEYNCGTNPTCVFESECEREST
jgi:hypothetical protein